MLSRALDEIFHATRSLPDHLIAARRCYGHRPEAVAALRQLQDALMQVDAALLRDRPCRASDWTERNAPG